MKFEVTVIECERGWGQKVDEVREFTSSDKAWEFVDEFNKPNNKSEVPDWYMKALDPVRVE